MHPPPPTFGPGQGVFDAFVDAVKLGGGGREDRPSLGFTQLVQLLWRDTRGDIKRGRRYRFKRTAVCSPTVQASESHIAREGSVQALEESLLEFDLRRHILFLGIFLQKNEQS